MKECSHDKDAYYTRNYSHHFIKMIRINFEEKPIMNELFINSLINDISWRNIKEETS